ncbi:unnamed protein product, partial [Symbiodinium sp. CCMP2592]
MSFKRARAADQTQGSCYFDLHGYEDTLPSEGGDIEAAKKFRRLLVERFLDGSATATDTCQLAYWHVASGGEGAEDLALNPRSASRHAAEHLRCHLNKEFPEPDVEMVSVPMHLKKSAGRTLVQHPTRVTSIMIRNELMELGILEGTASPEIVQDFLKHDEELGDLYERHCVTIEALRQGFSREHI